MNQSQVMPSDNDRRRVSVGLLLMGGGIALLVADLVWHLSPASIPLFWFYLESLVPLRVHLLRFGGAIFLLLGSLLVAAMASSIHETACVDFRGR